MRVIYSVGFWRLVLKDGYRYIVQFKGKDFAEFGTEKLGRYAVDHFEGV